MSAGARVLDSLKLPFRGCGGKQAWLWAPLETIVITAIALAIGYFFMADEPFATRSAFPWLLFFPMLVALRYHSFYGLVCNVILLLFFRYTVEHTAWLTYLTGSCCLTVLAGEFSHSWFLREKRTQAVVSYTKSRLDNLSRAHYLMKLSHQHLEQSLITKPVTLRQIVAEIRQATIHEEGQLNKESLGTLLSLLSQYCGLISAAVFACDKGKISGKNLAGIGEEFTLDKSDLLFRKIDEISAVRYQTVMDLVDSKKSAYLAVVPLVTSEDENIAYLVIKDMLFNFISEETMETLNVILSYYSNDVAGFRKSPDILKKYPTCPITFARELVRMTDLSKKLGVDSHLVVITVEKSDRSEFLVKKLEQVHRGLDYGWLLEEEDKYLYLNLMPFSGSVALAGYINRMISWLKVEFGLAMGEGIFCYRAYKLTKLEPSVLIERGLSNV